MTFDELLAETNELRQVIANQQDYIETVQINTIEMILELMNETGPGKSGPTATDEFNRLKTELEQTIEIQRGKQ